MIYFFPGVEALLAGTEEAYHESWFRQDLRRSVVTKQMLKEEDVTALWCQFDRITEVEGGDVFVEMIEMSIIDRIRFS